MRLDAPSMQQRTFGKPLSNHQGLRLKDQIKDEIAVSRVAKAQTRAESMVGIKSSESLMEHVFTFRSM
jgi:hypothetical protein